MEKADTLLRTKLHQPFTSQKLVSRPRLQTRIAEGLRSNPLTLIIAPAGFGKTTLITASVPDRQKVAWLSIDRDDNQIGRFLAYLIAALQSADERIGNEAAHILAGMQQVVTETLLTSLINDIDTSNEEVVLILDDFQFISNQEVLSAVAFLLDHCPLAFHLLIATRSDPSLPLSRMRARGQLVEMRAADLRFSEDEAIQFLNDVMGLHLEPKAMAILEERTEGWIAGLQMAALSMRDRDDIHGFIEGFSGTNRHILDYLLEEIMACQSPEIQHFLLYSSILDRLTAPLCDAVLADDEYPNPDPVTECSHPGLPTPLQSVTALSYLERENIFLISLDDERTWFRYHHLFTDLLRAKLQQVHSNIIPQLHIRAAAWLEANGFITEAIQHLLVAREFEHAADLIERYGPGRLEQSDTSVFEMADRLPHEILINHPKISLYQGWLLIIRGQIKNAIPLLTNVMQQLSNSKPQADERWVQTFISTAMAFLSPPYSSSEKDPLPNVSLLDEIPAEEMILQNAADFLYGMALARRGRLDDAVAISLKCIERGKAQQGISALPNLAAFVTRIYLMTGQLRACADMCHEYLDPVKESGIQFIYTSGSMRIDLGEVMCEWNFLDEAEQYIREGLKCNEPWQNIMTDSFGLISLVRVLQAKGDFSGALQAVEKFETNLRSRSLPREFEEDFHTLKVRVQLTSGDLQTSSEWAEKIHHSSDYELHKELYRLTLAHLSLAQGRFENVEILLKGTTPVFTSTSRITRQIEYNLLLAAALHELRRQPEALALLDSCFTLAEPEGVIRIFLDGGSPVRELVTAYLKSDAPGHRIFAQKVMNEFGSTIKVEHSKTQPVGMNEQLSDREMEVLHLMALGQTNEEIARQLFVARGTIKAHAASIYRKLDVANRTEAVTRARQLGILS